MKKSIVNGVIYIESEKEQKYPTATLAISAAQWFALGLALEGYLVTSTYDIGVKKVEVTVHFTGKPFPKINNQPKPTTKTITSHQYWQKDTKSMARVRCMDLTFEF